jgi:hypothetical protein
MSETSETPVFYIGLALAGAVSAGAYTAGVFDFLIEALNEFEKAKARGDDFVPHYDVRIAVVSGSSAGGMTGALGLASLAGGIRPTETASVNPEQDWPVRRHLPELYDAWVVQPRLFGPHTTRTDSDRFIRTGNHSFLDNGDLIDGGAIPASLLNSELLTDIAQGALKTVSPTDAKYRFFTEPTHLFLTLSNLDGLPYPISFLGLTSTPYHVMSRHSDHAHYAISGLGIDDFPRSLQLDA